MRRRLLLATAGVVVVSGAAITVVLAAGSASKTSGARPATTATATTTVQRRDLVEFEAVQGRLGYADARPAFHAGGGTVTWLPAVGARIRPGHRLFQVDGRSTFLFDGAQPVYRALGPGLRGTDVLQAERTLRDLGDDPDRAMRVDGTWDAGTTAAVRRWQERTGQPVTGQLELGSIVFAPGERRVAARGVRLGASLGVGASSGAGAATASGGAEVLTTTSTRQIVAIDLQASKQELAVVGTTVRVTLPSDTVVRGTIVRRAGVTQTSATATSSGSSSDATVKVIVRLRRTASAGPDQSPVDVDLERRRASNVLVVPVTALVAQEGGGFAVEEREGDRRRIVPVRTGISSDSLIEISGAGVRSGQRVSNAAVQ